MTWLMFLMTLAAVAGVFVGADRFMDWVVHGDMIRFRRRRPEPLPPVLLALELRRLSAELAKVEAGNQPAKATRINACRWAYDRVLLDYCHALELPVPTEHVPLTREQRFAAEEVLVGSGHGW